MKLESVQDWAEESLRLAKMEPDEPEQRSLLADALMYMSNINILHGFNCPECFDPGQLQTIIIHLNDDHKWRRCETDPGDGPTITEWLDELEKSGYDLTVKFTIEGENNE